MCKQNTILGLFYADKKINHFVVKHIENITNYITSKHRYILYLEAVEGH